MAPSADLEASCKQLGISIHELGIMIVDHGSRRAESNTALLDVVRVFNEFTEYQLIEPAHMELAEPSIGQAFSTLVDRGAKFVVVHPYFLLPGRHWAQDIPNLAAEAAKEHPHIDYLVSSPLGIHSLMAQIMNDRIQHCLAHRAGGAEACEICDEVGRCSSDYVP